MTVSISKALGEGSKAVICASTGNTSASAAAYAARAGLVCAVLIPEGHIALGKLAQALIHGAKVIQIKGNFDQALTVVRELAARDAITLVNSVNPYRLEGQKTAAFEIVEELGDAPDVHCIPVGNAGNITAYRLLAEREGVFCEPASAASVAGLLRAVDGGMIRAGETVVCTLTGHGLKDPERAISTVDLGISIEPTAAAVAAQLGL